MAVTQEYASYAAELIANGRYDTTDEVLAAALDALRREEAGNEAKWAALLDGLDEAEASGVYEGDIFAELEQELSRPA